MSAIRSYFARQPDPYAGGDLDNAQRIGTVVWALLTALTAFLVSLNPPTGPLGPAGWGVAACLIIAGLLAFKLMRTQRIRTWESLLAISYGTVASIAVLQWLGGGMNAPFRGLLLLPVLMVGATQPPRRIAAFMGFVLIVLVFPFFYDSWDGSRAEGITAGFVIWCALAVGASVAMMDIRRQRVALEAAGDEARAEARIDALTGLPNRRAYDELLVTEVARARRLDLTMSLAMIDIVDFKTINDRWSPAEGDRCLRELADALRETLREPDFCFRWGGDEFVLVLAGTRSDETSSIADRLESAVSSSCARPDGTPLRIRFATVELRDGLSPRELTEMAGVAMTAAKLDGAQTTNATSST
jgi:diguanylate cyclase (GGDEF)-like protein